MAVCRFRPLSGRRKPEVTSPFDSSTLVSYLCLTRITCLTQTSFGSCIQFLIVDYGGLSISNAKGRLRLEMRSPVDRATAVFYSCFVDSYHLSSMVSTL
jgi:hypothetical protein